MAPERLGPRRKVFEETFISPFEKETEGDALRVLEEIRKNHPPKKGWMEVMGFVEKLPNGKFRAVRIHAQYI